MTKLLAFDSIILEENYSLFKFKIQNKSNSQNYQLFFFMYDTAYDLYPKIKNGKNINNILLNQI